MPHRFSYTESPSACFLWRGICSDLLSCSHCWVLRALCICGLTVLYWICHFQVSPPSWWLGLFSLSRYVVLFLTERSLPGRTGYLPGALHPKAYCSYYACNSRKKRGFLPPLHVERQLFDPTSTYCVHKLNRNFCPSNFPYTTISFLSISDSRGFHIQLIFARETRRGELSWRGDPRLLPGRVTMYPRLPTLHWNSTQIHL